MGIQDWWMLGRLATVTLALPGALATPPSHAQAETYDQSTQPGRHALVIGNASHAHLAPLPSAREDMQRVSEQLKALGFVVMTVDGLASADIFNDEVLPKFRSQLRVGDLVIFYFSGHGFSYGPDNFLAPQDLPATLTRTDPAGVGLAASAAKDGAAGAGLVDAYRAWSQA
jgi:hypothetical protein